MKQQQHYKICTKTDKQHDQDLLDAAAFYVQKSSLMVFGDLRCDIDIIYFKFGIMKAN